MFALSCYYRHSSYCMRIRSPRTFQNCFRSSYDYVRPAHIAINHCNRRYVLCRAGESISIVLIVCCAVLCVRCALCVLCSVCAVLCVCCALCVLCAVCCVLCVVVQIESCLALIGRYGHLIDTTFPEITRALQHGTADRAAVLTVLRLILRGAPPALLPQPLTTLIEILRSDVYCCSHEADLFAAVGVCI